MVQKIYNKKGYYIVKVNNGYIAVNSSKEFEQGHTHIRNYKGSICAVEYARKQKIPKGCDIYFLTSLQRLSEDQQYIDKLEELKQIKLQKNKNFKISGGV